MEQSKPRSLADRSTESSNSLPGGPPGSRQASRRIDPRLNAALTALDYSQRVSDAGSLEALCFLLTNDSRAFVPFDRCSLITHLGGESRLRAVNGQPILEKKSAFHVEITRLAPELRYLTKGLLLPINESTDIPAEKHLDEAVVRAMEAVRSFGESSGSVFVAVLPLKHKKDILGHALVEFFQGTDVNRIGVDLFMRLGPCFGAALAEAWILDKKPRLKALIETSTEPARDRAIRSARRYGLAAGIVALLLVVLFYLPISATVGGEAQVIPRDRRIAFSKVEGLIDRILVNEGEQVQEGQVLAALDPKELDYKIASAKAELDVLNEKAALYRSYLDEDPAKLAESRLVELRIKAARLDLQYYQWQRQFLEIKAPCTGIVLTKDVQTLEGKKLATGEAFCEIAVPGDLWVDVYVPEDSVANVRPGNHLRLYLNNEPLKAHKLTVEEITPSAEADPRLGNVYRVKAPFLDGHESARVGMKGIGKIDTGQTTLWSVTTQRFARLWNQWSLWFSDTGVADKSD